MKIFLTLRRLFAARRACTYPESAEVWTGDPLDHPAIRRMTPRELADLPFDRTRRQNCR
jgi:hypothetical protein